MSATLDGVAIFGAAVKMVTSDNPRGEQQNAYPGLSGVESLDMGLRGRFTSVSGILYGGVGNPVSFYASSREAFRAYNDGQSHVLVDTTGTTWLDVRMKSFEPQGRVLYLSDLGYCQYYTASFFHQV